MLLKFLAMPCVSDNLSCYKVFSNSKTDMQILFLFCEAGIGTFKAIMVGCKPKPIVIQFIITLTIILIYKVYIYSTDCSLEITPIISYYSDLQVF